MSTTDHESGSVSAETEMPETDPVCKMRVQTKTAAASYEWQARIYYFCSQGCQQKFKSAPQKFLESHPSDRLDPGSASLPAEGHGSPLASEALKNFYLAESALKYSCPMHPEQVSNKPGSCAICGMALEAALPPESEAAGDELPEFRKRFLVALGFTLPLLAVSMPEMLGLNGMTLNHEHMPYLQLLLTLPVVLYSAAPIFAKARTSLANKHLNMFTLIAFGVSISFLVSLVYLLLPMFQVQSPAQGHGNMLYFESAASIVTLVLLGQILELKARKKSSSSLETLFALAPNKARRVLDSGTEEEIAVFEVKKGDRLRVLPGDKFPADGQIISGRSYVQETLLSGNSLPVSKAEGEHVLAGTINGDGSLLISADSLGRDTVFAQVIDMLASAQRSRSPMQEFADRVSAIFIPAVLLIAVLTFTTWIVLGGSGAMPHAIKDMIAVLVIACPCALGLASPIAVSVAVARAAEFGLLVKDARALELLGEVSDIAIDKTGTLTSGSFELVSIVCTEGISEAEALSLAASLEQESKHPLAISICLAAQARGLSISKADKIISVPGLGISGTLVSKNPGAQASGLLQSPTPNSKPILVGSARFLEEQGISLEKLKQAINTEESKKSGSAGIQPASNSSLVYLAVEGNAVAVFLLADVLKAQASAFIQGLKELSVTPQIMSGDGKDSVLGAGKVLGIAEENLHYNLLPSDKVSLIETLKNSGHSVAMIGDGINDAAALKAAGAGIAMSGGSDLALSTAPITAMNNDLLTVLKGIRLGRLMSAKMKENLFLAFSYNIVALVFATGIFYPLAGIELDPAMAAAAMSLSSISVILNSMRIKLAKL